MKANLKAKLYRKISNSVYKKINNKETGKRFWAAFLTEVNKHLAESLDSQRRVLNELADIAVIKLN